MAKSALQILEYHKNIIWPVVKNCLRAPDYPPLFKIPPKFAPDVKYITSSLMEYPHRKGKYLRPTLLYLSAKAHGGNLNVASYASAAMQLSEEWILIHDDFEDDSLERRGQPALHRQYSPEIAVNAGDGLHAVMWKALFTTVSQLSPPINKLFIDEFYRMIYRTFIGQGVEIKWIQENKMGFSDDDWFFIADSKSAYYTIAGPLRLGAIIAGCSNQQLEILTKFGVQLGRCFQLVDDILDVTSDFAGLKKQKGNDIYEGKHTIMLGHLFRSLSPSDHTKLIQIMSKPRSQKTPAEVDWILSQMQHRGSITYAKSIANHLEKTALHILEDEISFPKDQDAKEQLKTLTSFILTRDH